MNFNGKNWRKSENSYVIGKGAKQNDMFMCL